MSDISPKKAYVIFIIFLLSCAGFISAGIWLSQQVLPIEKTTAFQLKPAGLIAPAISSAELKPGGDTTVGIQASASFQHPAANLPLEQKPDFHAGKALAHQPWVKAPTVTTARDGLGPLYNARTCLMCHVKGGKGFVPPRKEIPIMSTLVRVSVPDENSANGFSAHPVYGDQIQGQSTSLAHQLRHSQKPGTIAHDVAPEAFTHIDWQKEDFVYSDGSTAALRKPILTFSQLGYGEFGEGAQFSIRVAPMIQGSGLIDLIPQQQIDVLADENDNNNDGISGRVNQVWSVEQQQNVPGRFGLKANQPDLRTQVAAAFANDVGITNSLFPQQPCSELQTGCNRAKTGAQFDQHSGKKVEIADDLLKLVVDFNRNMAPVKRRNANTESVIAGRELFYQSGCAQCHNPSFKTANSEEFPHLSNQMIWPYSDFLLHDMGEDLADNRPDFLATGNEWRTPPLWGLGLREQVNGSKALLHDGRAETIEEAILWHGGEAAAAKGRFTNLSIEQRQQLIEFVNSL